MEYERMLDKNHKPSEREILDYLGGRAGKAWSDIVSFLRTSYDFSPELDYGGTKYGWSVRYRKGGKSLCTLYPEKDAFAILIVLGRKEVEQFEEHMDDFDTRFVELFKSAQQFHDGRWLWIRILDKSDREDIRRLITMKKKPKNK
jgi:hypothetical protein